MQILERLLDVEIERVPSRIALRQFPPGNQHSDRMGIDPAHRPRHVVTGHAGHAQVDEHRIVHAGPKILQRLLPAAPYRHFVRIAQQAPQHVANPFVVIHHQQFPGPRAFDPPLLGFGWRRISPQRQP